MERAGVAIRFAAAFIDTLIMSVFIGGVVLLFFVFAGKFGDPGQIEAIRAAPEKWGAMFASIITGLGLFYTTTEIFLCGTPGKRILRIYICAESGNLASFGSLVVRWASKNSPNILGFVGTLTAMEAISGVGGIAGLVVFIGCFFIFGASKQALHDRIALTAVCYGHPSKRQRTEYSSKDGQRFIHSTEQHARAVDELLFK